MLIFQTYAKEKCRREDKKVSKVRTSTRMGSVDHRGEKLYNLPNTFVHANYIGVP